MPQLILSVDDESDIRESVNDVLTDAGFKVITAKDGTSMLKKLEKIEPDLIILDILMPGMTTKEILAELKQRKIKIPIIFLSVVRLAEATKKHIIKGNMVDYIEKPFDNEDFIKKVKKALKK
ncbi:response regulator [Candidatus Woesearchaeota archaeon]|nr:response regulator [Candidatus Woesearchaeota archaeon]